MGHCGLTIFFYNVFGRCPLLRQHFFTVYSITVSVALLSAAVVAVAAAGCLRFAAPPMIFF